MRRVPGMIGFAVGLGAALSPRTLVRLYGADPRQMTAIGALGWRLFAARNLVVGGAAAAGHEAAQNAVLAIQLPDQLIFWEALRTEALPRRTAAFAIATSAAVVAADLAARRRGGSEAAKS